MEHHRSVPGLFPLLLATVTVAYSAPGSTALDTELLRAVRVNNTGRVLAALKSGANPNVVDTTYRITARDGSTKATKYAPSALIIALDWRARVSRHHITICGYIPGDPPAENVALVKALITAGANVHARNEVGCTPLMLAAWQGKKATVDLLLQKDKKINAQGKDGDTALMLAISHGDEDTVRTLVRHGADTNHLRNKEGYTSLSLTRARGDKNLEHVLMSTVRLP